MNNYLTSEQFWQFSVRWYERSGVQPQCLALQDDCDVNVNMLLLLCWCIQNHALVTLPQWQQLAQALEATDSRLKAHRTKRKAAKGSDGYEALKAQELRLEAEQQRDLIAAFNQCQVSFASRARFNPSPAGFANLYQLRENQTAMTSLKRILAG